MKTKNTSKISENRGTESFIHVATSNDESTHNIGITSDGAAYTWGKSNSLGQLGRDGKKNKPQKALFSNPATIEASKTNRSNGKDSIQPKLIQTKAVKGYVGGTKDAGHSAILDENGYLWFTGCDRWQQLGLGSSTAGAAGYTWTALWQETFQRNDHLRDLMKSKTNTNDGIEIRDVAIGGDHTLVLSNNKKDVFSFGKGREGQLGLQSEKPFVSSPVHAKALSSTKDEIAAVCAVRHCSFTVDDRGNLLKSSGKCKQWNSEFMTKVLKHCQEGARKDGLIAKEESR